MPTPEEIVQLRLLSADTTAGAYLLDDEQLGALLTLEGGNIKLGAARALETVAVSEILRAKKISTQDLTIDGPAVAAALRASAALLRQQVADEVAAEAAGEDGFGFDFVDFPRVDAWPARWG